MRLCSVSCENNEQGGALEVTLNCICSPVTFWSDSCETSQSGKMWIFLAYFRLLRQMTKKTKVKVAKGGNVWHALDF